MRRMALLLLVVFTEALAHPGHDAPEPQLHAAWEVWLLLGLLAVGMITRTVRQRSRGNRARGKLTSSL